MGFEIYKNESDYEYDESNGQAKQVNLERLSGIGRVALFDRKDDKK